MFWVDNPDLVPAEVFAPGDAGPTEPSPPQDPRPEPQSEPQSEPRSPSIPWQTVRVGEHRRTAGSSSGQTPTLAPRTARPAAGGAPVPTKAVESARSGPKGAREGEGEYVVLPLALGLAAACMAAFTVTRA